jgi:hypothetical protein
MACGDGVGLLSACVEWVLSSPSNSGGGNGDGGTIARITLMHLVGVGRGNLANYSTGLHRLARVVALPVPPGSQDDNNCNGGRPKRS